MAVFRIKESFCERPIMAVLRSPGSDFQCLLTRKLPLKPAESAAIYDPEETLSAVSSE
jgi:hypothetical protein